MASKFEACVFLTLAVMSYNAELNQKEYLNDREQISLQMSKVGGYDTDFSALSIY